MDGNGEDAEARRLNLPDRPLARTRTPLPVDCWRFYPDGYRALAEYGNVDVLEAHTDWGAFPFAKGRVWGDTVDAFAKRPYKRAPEANRWVEAHRQAEQRALAERAASEVTRVVEGALRSAKRTVVEHRN